MRCRYSDWLRDGRLRGQSSSPGRGRRSDQLWGPPNLPIEWVPGALSSAIKLPEREADHSRLTSAEVKKMWIYTSTPPYAFVA
jgi:hypothetical protein